MQTFETNVLSLLTDSVVSANVQAFAGDSYTDWWQFGRLDSNKFAYNLTLTELSLKKRLFKCSVY